MAERTANGSRTMLWHKDFCKICVVNFFIALSVYMLLPVLSDWLGKELGLSPMQVALSVAIPGIGAFFFGGTCSYLTQKYRRNMVCIIAILLLAANILAIKYIADNAEWLRQADLAWCCVLVSRFFLGAFFGLAYLVLNSTLTIDCCDTSKRTHANTVSARIYLAATVGGPLVGFFAKQEWGSINVYYAAASLCLASAILLRSVTFPFKAPEETVKKFSLDRFIIPSSMPLAIPVALVSFCLATLAMHDADTSKAIFMPLGIIAGIAIQHTLLENTGHGKQTFGGCFLLVLSSAILLTTSGNGELAIFSRIITGIAAALILYNLHLGLTETADHCQRGTAQSTFILLFELGTSSGAFLYLAPCFTTGNGAWITTLIAAILIVAIVTASTRRFISRKLK